MNKVSWSIFILSASLILCFSSCGFFNSKEDKVKYIPVKIGKADAKYSLIDVDGKVVLESEFPASSEIYVSGDLISEQISSGEFRYWKFDGKKVIQIGENKYSSGIPFSEGYAIVQSENGRLSLIDDKGEEVNPNLSKVSNYSVVRVASPSEGIMRFKSSDGLWGYIDLKGEIQVDPSFISAENFKNGLARVLDKQGVFSIINTKGEIKYKGKEGYTYGPIVEKDKIFFMADGGEYWGILDFKGDKVLNDTKYDRISIAYNSGMVSVREGVGQWGVVNFKGEVVGELRTKFESEPLICRNGMVIVNSENEPRIFESKGNLLKKLDEFVRIFPFAENRFFAKQKNDKYVVINDEGKEISKDAFILDERSIETSLFSFINYADIYKNQNFTIESKYFEFDPIFNAVFNSISENGVVKVTSNSNIESILKIHPYKSESKGNNVINFSKSNDYKEFMISSSKKDNEQSVQSSYDSPSSETVDTTAVFSEVSVDTAAPTVASEIKDNYPFIYPYSNRYTKPVGNVSGLGYQISFDFNEYLKQEITGPDPIYTSLMTTIGYNLNKSAKLEKITISFSFYDIDNSVFWKEFEKKAKAAGFVQDGENNMKHSKNPSRRISYYGSTFIYYF